MAIALAITVFIILLLVVAVAVAVFCAVEVYRSGDWDEGKIWTCPKCGDIVMEHEDKQPCIKCGYMERG